MDTVTIKINKEVKKVAQKQARREGISLANLFASRITSFFSYPISKEDFRSDEKLNARTIRELTKISKDAKEGKNLSPVFKTVEEMKKYLMK